MVSSQEHLEPLTRQYYSECDFEEAVKNKSWSNLKGEWIFFQLKGACIITWIAFCLNDYVSIELFVIHQNSQDMEGQKKKKKE